MNIDGEGVKGEQRAVEYLLAEGYNVLDRNVEYARRGEIDIVCERRGVLVFVEVKSRSSNDYGEAVEAVDRAKRRKLLRAAEAYLSERDINDKDIRFDVITVKNDVVEHIPNAFYGYWN